MSKFNKGDKVKNSRTGEVGYIIDVLPARRGRQLYKVKYDDRENDELSTILEPNVDLTDPFERCRQNYFNHYTDYLKQNIVFKIGSSNKNTISSLKASRTLFRPYQFKPLLKFLNSDDRRLLIADEVGLGKTIEAGHIMLELKARNEFHNALVVCPMSLRSKWIVELSDKFGLDFAQIDKKEDLIRELQFHNGHVRAVVNYDKIRENSDILKYIAEKKINFSIVVCDESHRLRNNNTLIYHGATELLKAADSVVFMSATPIMLNEENLYNQLHLLDSGVYDNYEVFRNNLQLNRPFVKALSELNAGVNLKTIADELQNAEVATTNTINEVMQTKKFLVDDYFREYPIYQEIIKGLHSAQDTHSIRARIQYNLSEMSPMNTIFSRTRKREVTSDWTQAERNPVTERVSLTQDETQAYNDAIEKYSEDHTTYDEYGREHTGKMGLVTLRRQLASSVWATLSNDELLSEGYDMYSKYRDSKFDALLHIIDTVFAHGKKKIIVFAVFKKTLKYLSIRLAKKGIKSVMIYGDSKINKNERLNLFRDDDTIQVLLSSEVGSEGLDMQFCNSLVNYDLPWNPMVVEQRIGRIDRFGQESPKINIYNIVVTNSILEKIYERLLYRIGIFRESIGDLEAILDGEMNVDGKFMTIRNALQNVERQFYSDELSEEEVKRKQQQIEQAVENEKLNLKNIEDGLTNTLTNDSYFRNEINKIVNNNAYVTGTELYQLVRQIIKECLSVCRISPTDDKEIFNLEIPKSAPDVILHFLERYEPADPDNRRLFSAFKKKIDGKLIIPMTFNQERAFKNKELTYVNIYHPMIQAGVRMFEEKRNKKECTFFFELTSQNLPKEIVHTCYILAIYKVSVSRNVFDKNVKTDSLYPLLYDMNDKKVVADQELAEKFMGRAQVDGRYAPIDEALHIDDDTLDNMRYDLKDSIDSYVESYRKDLQNRLDNSKRLRYQQTIQYYSTREKSLERSISSIETIREVYMNIKDNDILRNAENTLRLLNANLRDLKKRKEKDLEKINSDVDLKVTEEIKSLNLVKVIQ